MSRIKQKYSEHYRKCMIIIYGTHYEWMWQVENEGKVKTSPSPHETVKSAVDDAKNYIDKKAV